MRILLAAVLLLSGSLPAFAGGIGDRIVIHLVDPRGVASSGRTIGTQVGDGKADSIATRTLSASEASVLRGLLDRELSDDDGVPMCGHHPGYAVQVFEGRQLLRTITLCGFCDTWASDGKLRVLNGKESLRMLERLLPLPDVFADAKTPLDLSPLRETPILPFHKLDIRMLVEQNVAPEPPRSAD